MHSEESFHCWLEARVSLFTFYLLGERHVKKLVTLLLRLCEVEELIFTQNQLQHRELVGV